MLREIYFIQNIILLQLWTRYSVLFEFNKEFFVRECFTECEMVAYFLESNATFAVANEELQPNNLIPFRQNSIKLLYLMK